MLHQIRIIERRENLEEIGGNTMNLLNYLKISKSALRTKTKAHFTVAKNINTSKYEGRNCTLRKLLASIIGSRIFLGWQIDPRIIAF